VRIPSSTPSSARPSAGDLDSRAEIHDLVVRFYREVVFDDLLGPVFDEVAEVDWSTHIPKLIDFWCRVLLGEPGYDGAFLGAHQRVHQLESFRPELFDRWYRLFVDTVDDGWCGPGADRAKAHAAVMARNLSRRILGEDWTPAGEASPPWSGFDAAAGDGRRDQAQPVVLGPRRPRLGT
jgi:hemoglobin